MEILLGIVVGAAALIIGFAAYCNWAEKRDQELDAMLKQFNDETDTNIADALKRRDRETEWSKWR
jgi:hypothetical protein